MPRTLKVFVSGHRAQDADTGSSGPHTATGALIAGHGS